MKIITWNCNMAFRKKATQLLQYSPDILVIPECECPDKLIFQKGVKLPTDILWYGSNPNKGLGVFSYGNYRFKLLKTHNPAFKIILPIAVTGGAIDFTLFAIWANNPQEPEHQYVGQVWKAMNHYQKLIRKKQTLLIGDFNSNTIWDKPRRVGNHTDVVNTLAKKGISSVYHQHHNQTHGTEQHPTFSLYRHQNKPYHLDYCFASADFTSKLKHVEIGSHQDWCGLSDHLPLMAEFDV
jgi:exonuclease III